MERVFSAIGTAVLASLFTLFAASAGSLGAGEAQSGGAPAATIPLPIPRPPQDQTAQYNAQVPKSVIELQQFRETTSIPTKNEAGQTGKATLINLNPLINAWFLLRLEWDHGRSGGTYHLGNHDPEGQQILLDPQYPSGLMIASKQGRFPCDLWSEASDTALDRAGDSHNTYAPICGERLYLRNKTKGHRTAKEMVTDLLRQHVWHGEAIVTFVKDKFYRDAYLETADLTPAKVPATDARQGPPGAPAPPLLNPRYGNDLLDPVELAVKLEDRINNKVVVGRWYGVRDMPGVFVSVVKPGLVSEQVIWSEAKLVNPLDEVESKALVFLVAFDLDQFQLGYAMGTEHPGVEWSDRIQESVRDNSLPGPDGIGTVAPLVMTGMLSPVYAEWVAATFTGGFKRDHGAFRWGDLALKNHGSHYGFIQNGVVMSKLQPGLATVLVFDNGAVELKTWTDQDNKNLARIRHARQNGVPIIEYDASAGTSRPGALVPFWGPGNWSGSEDKRLRTLRAGLALQEQGGRQFLIYGYFSSASPSAMARVFQAYRCKYAMHLDMNALEHTYLALYRVQGARFLVQDLVEGMSVLDKSHQGQVVPRFVGYADNRDFFFLLRKKK
jgi:hypothetical protein